MKSDYRVEYRDSSYSAHSALQVQALPVVLFTGLSGIR